MAYRQPSFMVTNPFATANLSLSLLTPRNAGAMTDANKRLFVDLRQQTLGAIVATGLNAGIGLDMGTTSRADEVNRCVIPAGHTLATRTIEIIHSTASNFVGAQLSGTATPASNAVVDIDCSLVSSVGRRYWAVELIDSVNAVTYSLSELWLGARRTLSADAYVQPGWALEWVHDLTDEQFGGRTATLELSAPRRRFRLEVVNVTPGSADWTALDEVAWLGRSRPFWYWPPDDATPGPFLVQLASAAIRRQEFRAPTVAIRYAVALEMVEQLS